MSVQENSWSRRGGRQGALLSSLLLLALVAAVGGCGGSGSEDVTAAKAKPPGPCRVGGPAAPHVPNAPAVWSKGPKPAIALTCSPDQVDPEAAIVGYPLKGGGACVSAYSTSLGEVFGELCEPSGSQWTSQCTRAGCVYYFHHEADSTVLAGPVPDRVSGVWASVGGSQVTEGVILTNVRGKRMQMIGAREPFGYFSVYIPRCLEPSEVQVHMVTGGSKQAGLVDEWNGEGAKCPPRQSARSS